MQAEGTLTLFAEVFVAFAGFTGLAGVLLGSAADSASLLSGARFLAAADFFPATAQSVYLFTLAYSLFGTAVTFARLVKPIWHTAPGGGGASDRA